MNDNVPEKLLKPYNPKETEGHIYKKWEESGFFNPDKCVEEGVASSDSPVFSMVLPPPNVTGTLHMGHAAMLAIEDVLTRFHRMKGERTLWLPGTDHAAIATQNKVESIIYKSEDKTRHDFTREEFLKRVEQFASESHDTIVGQIKRMGSSVDWSREAYTLDEKRNLAVKTAFKRMYDAGLIYRGYRVVNWDPKGQTTVSDEEVVYQEEKGNLYTFKYSPDFPIAIATTRPETKVGDTAIAVHPDDPRYKEFIGKTFNIDFVGMPLIVKIVGDQAIDPSFGTGAVGVTPAHSMTDFEISRRHGLPLVPVINEYGKMTVADPELNGKKTKEARAIIVERLRAAGLLKKEEEILQNIPRAERTNGIIEQLPKLQWFVNVNKKFSVPGRGEEVFLREWMQKVVADGSVTILPERFSRIYTHWIENLHDWCISRQILFGHRIPVWYCLSCNTSTVDGNIKSKWFIVRHGETESNKVRVTQGHKDSPLTADGRAQVSVAAEKLKNQDVGLIISSDLGRARETAEIISQQTGAPIIFDSALRERYYGDGEGMGYDEINEKYGPAKIYESRMGDSETYKEVEERAWNAFAKHKELNGHKNVVIVSHGGSIRMLIKRIKNLSPEETMTRPSHKNAEIFSLDILDKSCSKCGSDLFEQDPDTLDTWFSSGLWTFSTLGWPNADASDFKTYHPTNVLETGYDILFFWVARMILMSGFLLGDVPFRNVYLHGLVRDGKGQKMSKSLGNIIDPVDMAEKYGADAARLSLIVGNAPGNDLKLSEDKIRGYKHFANKLWNMARFVLSSGGNNEKPDKLSEADNQIISEFKEIISDVTKDIEEFRLHLASEKLYHYAWHRFADIIIEESKPILNGKDGALRASRVFTLESILADLLRLLHPFIPFVTEEIWSVMPARIKTRELLMVEKWPVK